MAPEILRLQKYGANADLWSVGAIMFEMLTKRPPFTGTGRRSLIANIETKTIRYPDGIVIFMAPTRPLVQQQIHACTKCVGQGTIPAADGFVPCPQCGGAGKIQNRSPW